MTSLGNDNYGGLSFTYGLETDDIVNAEFVFNAHDASWITFIRNLFVADQVMYRNRESAGCFNSANYLAKAKAYQSIRPERVWVADAQRKYLRPYEDKGTETYLKMLAGKKTHQREQVKTYNSYYYASKYVSDFCTSQNIMVRGNTPTVWHGVAPANTATLSMYIDCYIVVASTSYNVVAKVRAKRGQTYVMDFSTIGSMGETELYFCTAPMITELSGLAHLYFKQNNFAMGTNLQRLEIGSNVVGYENPNLETLTIGNNKMLEYLDVRNCPNVSGALDLSGCISLKELYLENTNFTGISIAKGGLIETAHLDSPTSISMMELIYLNDLSLESANNLTTLRVENCKFAPTATLTINGTETTHAVKDIVLNLIDSSNNLSRVRLVGVDWVLPNTNVLNRALGFSGIDDDSFDIPQSVITGEAFVPTVQSSMLEIYNDTWKYLTIRYNAIIAQYMATFVNADGSPIKDKRGNNYIQFVDSGSAPYNPVTMGYEIKASDAGSPITLGYNPVTYSNQYYLDTLNGFVYYSNGTAWSAVTECDVLMPTMEETPQYSYEFNGWDDIESAVYGNKTITAVYIETIRKYTVTYYKTIGIPLETHTNIPYGDAISYEGGIPTWTEDESRYTYRLFKGWDKATGFIKENLDVFAIWDVCNGLPSIGTEMKDMTLAQIYAVGQAGQQANYFEDMDYFEIDLGKDYNYSNVESIEIGKDVKLNDAIVDKFRSGGYYFDGNTAITTDIKLFAEDSPSFTMAIDFQFRTVDSIFGALVSSHEGDTSEGFRFYYNGTAPTIQWGDMSVAVGNSQYRDIVVLRHIKGSRYLYVYHEENPNEDYKESITKTALLRSANTVTDEPLTFGGVHYPSIGGYRNYGNGTIHWCKIWLEDLGEEVAYDLASWYHERARFEYWGPEKYYYYNSSQKCKLSFVSNNILGDIRGKEIRMNSTNTNTGGFAESEAYRLCNNRFFNGLPTELQSAIKAVDIKSTIGNGSNAVTVSNSKVYLLACRETSTVTSEGYINEVGTSTDPVSWFTNNFNRAKFKKIRRDLSDNDVTVYHCKTEPSALYQTSINDGDIWVYTNNNNKLYIYLTGEEMEQYGLTPYYKTDPDYSDGGWFVAVHWYNRSPCVYTGRDVSFVTVTDNGGAGNSTQASTSCGFVPSFSF